MGPGKNPPGRPFMSEHASFLDRNGERLFTFLHLPPGPCRAGALICAPLAEEKLWSHRVLVSAARELARAGYAVLRFDFRGEGDSDRRFAESSLATRIEDARTAIDELRRHLVADGPITVLGLRLGASIAALAALDHEGVDRLVLWEPVTDGAEYVRTILRSNLMHQMTRHRRVVEDREALIARLDRGESVNVEGYEFGGDLYRELSALRLDPRRPPATRANLLVRISGREAPPCDDLQPLVEGWAGTRLESVVEEPFWREIRSFYARAGNLFDATARWMGPP
jgi:exosortase A-associated hydrolase 2